MIDPNCLINKLSIGEKNQLEKEIQKTVGLNENVFIALKGVWKEYLICTDLQVYVIKRGMMTGHTFGGGVLKLSYHNITNAEVVYRMMSGYFEISAAGLDNKHYTHYQSGNPSNQPNCISIADRSAREAFETASSMIMAKVAEAHSGGVVQVASQTAADEIREYKALYDDGIITKAEFEKKKKELLK